MANTYAFDGLVLNISALDSDWVSTTHFKGTQRIRAVIFLPGAAAERCVLRSGSITGPKIYDSGPAAAALPPIQIDVGERMDLALVFADGVYVNAASTVVVVLDKTS